MQKTGVILYVDDEPINLKLFVILFRSMYEIITAESGSEALNQLESNPQINIVITDMKMPGMNGLEFVKKARSKYRGIPFFLLSGYGLTPEIENALDEQLIDGYFQKPINKSLIVKELQNHLNCCRLVD